MTDKLLKVEGDVSDAGSREQRLPPIEETVVMLVWIAGAIASSAVLAGVFVILELPAWSGFTKGLLINAVVGAVHFATKRL